MMQYNKLVDTHGVLKQGVWAYFLLLIFEGALRKWFFPSLATPLLVVRDPVALWLVYTVWQRGLLPLNWFVVSTMLVGVVGIFTATLLGHGSLPVALFGARILLLHFPLIFVIGCVFSRVDVIRMGKFVLFLAVPMTILVALQFYSPQTDWVNRGVGGEMGGAGFSGAMGYFRPPGTFSFTTGNTLFFGFVAPFVLYFWLNRETINNLLLLAATVALLFAIPLSISRSLLFMVGITIVFALIAILRNPQHLGRMLLAIAGGVLSLIILSQTSFFETAVSAFSTRLENANNVEGGFKGTFLDRFIGGLIRALTSNSNLPFWGFGLGMGTNVGSALLAGRRQFLLAEDEWGRIVDELGLLMGFSIVLIRLALTAKLALACYLKLVQGDLLPWMLLSYGLLSISGGGWAQPTSLGFSILITGLIVASLRNYPVERGSVSDHERIFMSGVRS